MVRSFILLFLLITSFCRGQIPTEIGFNYIRIDHAGPSDKPIIPLIISIKNLTLPITEHSIKVDENIIMIIFNYFENSKHLNLSKKVNEFGVFKITRRVDEKMDVRYTPTREESILFFKGLQNQLDDKQPPENLLMEIERVLERIDF